MTVTVYPTPTGGNDAPIAVNNSYVTYQNTNVSGSVLGNDTDPDGNLNYSSVTLFDAGNTAANGTLILNPDGTFTYDPNPTFTGTVTFTYQVCDMNSVCDQATVSIEIYAGNSTFATDDTFLGVDAAIISGTVLTNDYDPQGNLQTTVTLVGPAPNTLTEGTLVLNTNGTFTFTPVSGFKGTVIFVYQVCDNGTPQACDQATVYLDVAKKTKSCVVSNKNIHGK
jgi:hypothetical protein